jgi:UDP-glucose 4-epimerase
MKNILLTGGLGYIGSHIAVEILKNMECNVIIIDNLSNSTMDKLNNIQTISNRNVLFYQYDMMNIELIEKVFCENKIEAVIHLAGLKSVGESCLYPHKYYNTNINITLNLLEIMNKYQVYNFIFSSSATVYGSLDAPFVETMQTGTDITNPYGRTKYMIEEILKDYYKSNSKWKIVLLRYFNPIGSHNSGLLEENPNGIPNNLFPYILKVHKKELQQLSIFGNDYNTPDGTCLRDYIHVVDLATGHIKALEYILSNQINKVEIFNLGTGKPHSVFEIIDAFEKVNNTIINKKIVERRKGDIEVSYANSDRANKILDWNCIYDINDMVKL